jgi:hypothetical protein
MKNIKELSYTTKKDGFKTALQFLVKCLNYGFLMKKKKNKNKLEKDKKVF